MPHTEDQNVPDTSWDSSNPGELCRALFNEAADGMFISDPDGRYVAVNPRGTELAGYSREEILGMTIADLVPPEDLARDPIRMDDLRQDRIAVKERRLRRKDGSLLTVEVSARMLPRGELLAIVRDVTERKRSEQALKESEAKLHAILDATPFPVAVVDLRDDRIVFWSRSALALFGHTAPTGAEWCRIAYPDPDYRGAVLDRWKSLLDVARRSQSPMFAGEYRITCSDGSERVCELYAGVLADGLVVTFHDITERNTLAEATFEGIAITEQGVLRDCNEQLAHMLGHGRAELRGKPAREFIAPEHRNLVAEAQRAGRLDPYEHLMLRPDGTRFPVEVRARAAQIDGRQVRVTAIRDITERKRAEEATHATNEQLQALVRASPVAIIVMDPDGHVRLWNPAAERAFGWSEPEVLGRSLPLVPEDKQEEHRALRQRVLKGESFTGVEVHRRRKDGTAVELSVSTAPLRDSRGHIIGIMSVNIDVTGRREAEKALRRSEERTRLALKAANQGFYDLNVQTGEAQVSPEYATMLGYDPSEFRETNEAWIARLHPEDREPTAAIYRDYVAGKIPEYQVEFRQRTRSGDWKWILSLGRIVERDARGQPLRFLGTHTDITERKRAEEEKDRLRAQLLQAQKMESVGRLAGGVAHDFNNMLSAILGHAELAMMECSPSDPIRADLEAIQKAGQRSADLTRQLLAFARKQTVAPKALDLNETVTSMLRMLQRLIGEDIDLVWMPGAGLWPIRMDPSQVDQGLVNLCVNARDAIAGVGRVTIQTENVAFGEADCAARPDLNRGEYVMLAVSDDGCGMDKADLDRIFEPFFTTKQVGRGTGLGLATLYGIVKQNDGFIDVSSEPGQGSVFRVYLPRFAGKAAELTGASAPQVSQGGGGTVLLVEDEAAVLTMGKSMLERLGYTVLTAATPGDALRQAEAHAAEIRLLITDVIMPEMNGRDLARSLQSVKPGLKLLFTSGYTADVIAHRGVLDEGVHFLQKPFSLTDLSLKVRQALEGG